jgi:secreted trypsin-like serine protease
MIGASDTGRSGGADLHDCAAVGRLDIAGWYCSGVLVHARVVLTTAHSGPAGGSVTPRVVCLGTADLSDAGAADVIAGEFKAHEAYAGKGACDLAAMILERGSSVTPVGLATASEIASATEVILAGFGADREARLGLSVRRAVRVPIAFFSSGAGGALPDILDSVRFNPKSEFLAGAEDRGPSFGDSGGPAYVSVKGERKLAGIISRPAARQKPYCNGLTILTRVDAFESWIQSRIAQACLNALAPKGDP